MAGRKSFDPLLSTNDTIREFLQSYYGSAAAELVFQYYDVMSQAYRDAPTVNITWPPAAAARGDHSPLDWGKPNSTAYPARTVMGAGELLANATAAAAAASSPAGVERLMELRLGLNYLALLRWEELQAFAAAQKLSWPFGPSKRATFVSFSQILTASWGEAGWLGKTPLVSRGKPQCDLHCFEAELFPGDLREETSRTHGG